MQFIALAHKTLRWKKHTANYSRADHIHSEKGTQAPNTNTDQFQH